MKPKRKVKQFLLDLAYPNTCPCCNQLINWNQYVCDNCAWSAFPQKFDTCSHCGKLQENCMCGENLYYDRAFTLGEYENRMRDGILSLKLARSKNFAYACGEKLAEKISMAENFPSVDRIIPVPMERKKKRKRLLQPSLLVAEEISTFLGIPVEKEWLLDNGTGKSQHTLSAKERQKNVTQFYLKEDIDCKGKHIILVDDILTTGSTLNYCSQLLKEAGVKMITIAVPAVTPFRPQLHHTLESE